MEDLPPPPQKPLKRPPKNAPGRLQIPRRPYGHRPNKRWWPKFLDIVSHGGTVKDACDACGVCTFTFWLHKKKFPDFEMRFLEATDRQLHTVVNPEILRRITVGNLRKKFTKSGEPIIDPETGKQYVEYEKSDQILMFYARAMWPHIYGDKTKVEHSAPDGGPLTVIHEHVIVSQILADPESARLGGDLARRLAFVASGDGPQAN